MDEATASGPEMPVMEEKPGRSWDVIGREHLPLGKREDREASAARPVASKGMEPRPPSLGTTSAFAEASSFAGPTEDETVDRDFTDFTDGKKLKEL